MQEWIVEPGLVLGTVVFVGWTYVTFSHTKSDGEIIKSMSAQGLSDAETFDRLTNENLNYIARLVKLLIGTVALAAYILISVKYQP
jgi:hypothetical protein